MEITLCPICWHEETFRALLKDVEPCRDDMPFLEWHRPYGGACGQTVGLGSGGYWHCDTCGTSLSPLAAALMIDAVLRVSDPDNDTFNGETFEDYHVALKGDS